MVDVRVGGPEAFTEATAPAVSQTEHRTQPALGFLFPRQLMIGQRAAGTGMRAQHDVANAHPACWGK